MPEGVRDVLSYFLRNPQAADSLEGIARWRVRQETVHRIVGEIDRSLQWLVERGFLSQEAAKGSPPIFRLNCERVSDAERILNL